MDERQTKSGWSGENMSQDRHTSKMPHDIIDSISQQGSVPWSLNRIGASWLWKTGTSSFRY